MIIAISLLVTPPATAQTDNAPTRNPEQSVHDQIKADRAKEKKDEANDPSKRPWDRDVSGKRPWDTPAMPTSGFPKP